jgi:molybdopterin-containing oxidoreductase family membrane subunit
MYVPTYVDVSMYLGTLGFFFFMMFLFIRFLPMISIFEVRELLDGLREHVKSKEGHKAVTVGEDGSAH